MNSMEIQREAIVEIIDTQYKGRAVNHQNLSLNQKLILNRQSNNIHDSNAILILTEDGKELGVMPKGYASLYAPAIDSKKYSFSAEIIKTETDSERPILIVKIIAELTNCNEEEIEKHFIQFVQNIANGYTKRKKEYLQYISAKNVDINELVATLNRVRLISILYSLSDDIILKNNIISSGTEFMPLSKKALFSSIKDLKDDISNVLKKIQRAYNESLDIDDEEEYYRVQSSIREQRKKFRLYDKICDSYYTAVAEYSPIKINMQNESSEIPTVKKNTSLNKSTNDKAQLFPYSEDNFLKWLITDGNVSEITAKQYISNIHSIEKLYQSIFGVRKNMFEITSVEHIKKTIDALIQREEFIDANERRHNSFTIALNKFAQFTNALITEKDFEKWLITVDKNDIIKAKDYIRTIHTIENLYHSIFKRKNFSFFGILDLDTKKKEIELLLTNEKYIKTNQNCHNDMNISLAKYCSYANLTVNFETINEVTQLSFIEEDNQQETYSLLNYHNYKTDNSEKLFDEKNKTNIFDITEFKPDITKPFELKNAVTEILSSNSSEINNQRTHNNGITSKALRELISKHYGKTIGFFEISKLLMSDKTFKSVGKGCYMLKQPVITIQKSEKQNITPPKINSHTELPLPKNIHTADSPSSITDKNNLTASIIEVIKNNSDSLQYKDGFGAYEVKILLNQQGILNTSEIEIEKIMSECDRLTEIEEGYYIFKEFNKPAYEQTISHEIISQPEFTDESIKDKSSDAEKHIMLSINGEVIRAFDYSDALKKICEFAIIYKPFKMARIAGQHISYNSKLMFYRKAVPVDGYNKLSNGLQIIPIDNYSDLKNILEIIMNYCQISDDMITIISK